MSSGLCKEEYERINRMFIEQITIAYVLDSKLGNEFFEFFYVFIQGLPII